MTYRIEQLCSALAPDLEQVWISSRSSQRLVTCVSVVQDSDDLADCHVGELVLLTAGVHARSSLFDLVQNRADRPLTAVWATSPTIAPGDDRRLREITSDGTISAGRLSPNIDLRLLANRVGRLLASVNSDSVSLRLHAVDTLQGIAETLGRLVGNSVTIETPRGELLAHSAAGSDIDRPRQETILHRRAQHDVMQEPEFVAFEARVLAEDRPVRIRAYPEYAFAGRVAMRIATEGELFGVIWVTDTARRLHESDLDVIKQASEAAASHFIQRRGLAHREAEFRAELLDDVVQGRIRNPDNVRTVARTVGWNVDKLQQVLVVVIDDFEAFRLRHAGRGRERLTRTRERLLELVNLEVLAIDPEAVVGLRSSGVVVLLDTRKDSAAERKTVALQLGNSIVKHVAAFLTEVSVTVGVGRDFPSFEQIGEGFRQAEVAAELGASLWNGNRAVHYDDLGIHRVLQGLREQDSMTTPALQRIIAYDGQHHSDFVHTLAVYLRHMGRLRPAAEELGIHRNTLEYRIGRIVEVGELDLDDPDHRLTMELGLRVLELQRGRGSLSGSDTPAR